MTARSACVFALLVLALCVDGHGHSHDQLNNNNNHHHLHHHGHSNEHEHEHEHAHAHGHGHSHDFDEGAPSAAAAFKYSREANEAAAKAGAKVREDATSTSTSTSRQTANGKGHAHRSEKLTWTSKSPPRENSKFRSSSSSSRSSRLSLTLVLEALGSTIFISLVPFIILFAVPVDNTAEYESWLKVLLSFASGGLLGDAFLHLIPHAMLAQTTTMTMTNAAHIFTGSGGGGQQQQMVADGGMTTNHGQSHLHPHSHSHSHSHSHEGGEGGGGIAHHHAHDLSVGLWVLTGIGVFLLVEKCLRLISISSPHSHGHSHGHAHGHSHGGVAAGDKKVADNKATMTSGDQSHAAGDSPRKKSKVKEVKSDEIKVSGYLNLAADFIHNFTDGLAIGASYLAGQGIGIVTTVTVVFHEIPHEIGDFAILLQSGMNRKKAMKMQLVTALGAVTGTVFSLLAEGMSNATDSWVLPFTAGGFIYIATVSVIPELLKDCHFWQSVCEMCALVFGIGMMVLIAKFE